jgi:hypothetical protein
MIRCKLAQFTVSNALAKSSLMTNARARRLWAHWMISKAWMKVSEMQRPLEEVGLVDVDKR